MFIARSATFQTALSPKNDDARTLAQIKDVLNSAIQYEPSRRSAFLANVCRGDESLREEVESLIAAHEKDGSFMTHLLMKLRPS